MRYLVAVAALGLGLTACGRPATYESLEAFEADHQGWVVLGRFDLAWPAEVVSEKEGSDEISFTVGGTPHKYPGYDGYRLKVVKLAPEGGGEAAVVLRSAEKTH
jgi:hypothetical protein